MPRRLKIQPGGVRELVKAAKAVRSAEARLAGEILAAHEAGSSFRAIGVATGLSHETVRTILAAEKRRVAAVREQLDRPLASASINGQEREAARRRQLARSVKNPDA